MLLDLCLLSIFLSHPLFLSASPLAPENGGMARSEQECPGQWAGGSGNGESCRILGCLVEEGSLDHSVEKSSGKRI